MPFLQGELISGEFDDSQNEFAIQRLKSFEIQSVLNEKLAKSLYSYLEKYQMDREGMVLTLNDQMPILLTTNEIAQLLKDLKKVQELFH